MLQFLLESVALKNFIDDAKIHQHPVAIDTNLGCTLHWEGEDSWLDTCNTSVIISTATSFERVTHVDLQFCM